MKIRDLVPTLALITLVLPSGAVAAASTTGAPLAITGVSVVPMDAERVLADQTVVLQDGRIAAIGSSAAIRPPAGATVVDGEGLYLLPGLFDSHVHLREREAEAHLLLHVAHGVTTVQNMHGSPWRLELRRKVADGELLGPRIVTTGPTTARARVDSPERAEAIVAEQKAAGYDAIKMYGDGSRSMTEETYARVISAAHEAGMRVTGHAPRNHPFSMVLEHGQDSIDHLEEIVYTYRPITDVIGTLLDVQFGRAPPEAADELLAAADAIPGRLEPALAGLAREARAAGLAVSPTLIAFRTIWKQTTEDYPRLLEMPEMRLMHPLTRAEWGPLLNSYRAGWSDRLELSAKILKIGFDTQMAMIPHLQAAGVRILTGTDAPLELVFPGVSVHREMALLVEAGLTPFQALSAATVNPAEEMGLAADSGTVAAGKRADLVLVEGNPLDDVANAGRIAGVVVAGTWLPKEDVDRRVEAVAAGYDTLQASVTPLLAGFEAGDAGAVASAYRAAGDAGDEVAGFAERLINSLGYRTLNNGDAGGAVETFRLNTELFPEAANTWDSLGEGLLHAERFAESLASYRKALEVDPDMANARQYGSWLEGVVAARTAPPVISPDELARYAGDYGERHVRFEGGELVYFRGDNEPAQLVPLGDHRFMIDGVGFFLMRFELDRAGRAVKIVGSYAEGRSDESLRSD